MEKGLSNKIVTKIVCQQKRAREEKCNFQENSNIMHSMQ